MPARGALHAALVSLPRPPRSIRRSALAWGLAIGLTALGTSPGGAEPHGGTGHHTALALSEPVLRAVGLSSPGTIHGFEEEPTAGASPLAAELDLARQEESAARAALADAGGELDEARDARDTALSWAEAAQDELMRARIRLGDLIVAEEAAVADLRGAVGRVEGTRRGSKAYRSAFTDWQMAAVAERAAHLRRIIAAEVGSERFEQLQVAEAELTDVELALGRATSAHRKATRAVESASARVTQLEAEAFATLEPSAAPAELPASVSTGVSAAAPRTAERGQS